MKRLKDVLLITKQKMMAVSFKIICHQQPDSVDQRSRKNWHRLNRMV